MFEWLWKKAETRVPMSNEQLEENKEKMWELARIEECKYHAEYLERVKEMTKQWCPIGDCECTGQCVHFEEGAFPRAGVAINDAFGGWFVALTGVIRCPTCRLWG